MEASHSAALTPPPPRLQLIIRSLRKTDAQRTIDPEDVDGCFSAVNHSVSHFPDRVEVVLAMAIIQAFCLDDVHAAHSSAQKARGMPVSLVSDGTLVSLGMGGCPCRW